MKSFKPGEPKWPRKFNLREPLFCYRCHNYMKCSKYCRITIFTRGRRKPVPFYVESINVVVYMFSPLYKVTNSYSFPMTH